MINGEYTTIVSSSMESEGRGSEKVCENIRNTAKKACNKSTDFGLSPEKRMLKDQEKLKTDYERNLFKQRKVNLLLEKYQKDFSNRQLERK